MPRFYNSPALPGIRRREGGRRMKRYQMILLPLLQFRASIRPSVCWRSAIANRGEDA